MSSVSRRVAGLAALVAIAGCTGITTGPPGSTEPTDALSSTSEAPAGNLPEGCEPVELRAPAGEIVDLNGIWVQEAEGNAKAMTWWIRTFGNCLWANGQNDDLSVDSFVADAVQVYRGTIRSDFTIDGTSVLLGEHNMFHEPQRSAEVTFLIVFDEEGQITLREDREPSVVGPRCLDPAIYCIAPVVLHPLE
jgi:hypothetical protein